MTLPRLTNAFLIDDFNTNAYDWELYHPLTDGWTINSGSNGYLQIGGESPPAVSMVDYTASKVSTRLVTPGNGDDFIMNFKIVDYQCGGAGESVDLHFAMTPTVGDFKIKVKQTTQNTIDLYASGTADATIGLVLATPCYVRIVHDYSRHGDNPIADCYYSTTTGADGAWVLGAASYTFNSTRFHATKDIVLYNSMVTQSGVPRGPLFKLEYLELGLENETLKVADKPTASISSILYSPTYTGAVLTFTGSSDTTDGFDWRDNHHGSIGSAVVIATPLVQTGSHLVSFRAYDTLGGWSDYAYTNVLITTSTATNAGIDGLQDVQKAQYDYAKFLKGYLGNDYRIYNDIPHLDSVFPCIVVKTIGTRYVPYSCGEYLDSTNDGYMREVSIECSVYTKRALESDNITASMADAKLLDYTIDMIRYLSLRERTFLRDEYDIQDVYPESVTPITYEPEHNGFYRSTIMRLTYLLRTAKQITL